MSVKLIAFNGIKSFLAWEEAETIVGLLRFQDFLLDIEAVNLCRISVQEDVLDVELLLYHIVRIILLIEDMIVVNDK